MEVSKEKGKRTEHRIVRFTTGFHHLPDEGGVMDQPVWTMAMFELFKEGENRAAMTELTKN